MSKILAAAGIVIGGLSVIYDLLSAFSIYDVTDAQQGAIGGVAGLLLLVLGVWFHPDVPVGNSKP